MHHVARIRLVILRMGRGVVDERETEIHALEIDGAIGPPGPRHETVLKVRPRERRVRHILGAACVMVLAAPAGRHQHRRQDELQGDGREQGHQDGRMHGSPRPEQQCRKPEDDQAGEHQQRFRRQRQAGKWGARRARQEQEDRGRGPAEPPAKPWRAKAFCHEERIIRRGGRCSRWRHVLSSERVTACRAAAEEITVARYAGSMNDRPIPPAEAGGYFLKPATRARSAAVGGSRK